MSKIFSTIKIRVLFTLISLSLGALVLLSAASMYGVLNMRAGIIRNIDELSSDVTSQRADALIAIMEYELLTTASDKATVIDEKFAAIERQTIKVAQAAARIYTDPDKYAPRAIDYLHAGQENTPVPHIRTAPGVAFGDIREEAFLAANIEDVLYGILAADISVNANYIGAESGFFITVDKNAAGPENTNYDPTSRAWYIGAKETGGVYWSDVFLDSSGRGLSLSCSMPFFDERSGELKGVAGCGAMLDSIGAIIRATNVDREGYAFLLNDKGEVLISPQILDYTTDSDGNLSPENFLESEDAATRDLAERMTRGENGVMQLWLNGEDVYVGYAPLARNWSVGVVVTQDDVLAPVNEMRAQILALRDTAERNMRKDTMTLVVLLLVCSLFAVAAAIALSLRFANRLTDPIISLNKGVQEVSEGNLNAEIAVKSDDEIGQLATAFNAMTLRLRDYIKHLSEVTAERERMAAEMNVAQKIQASMLPSVFPPFPGRKEFDLYAEMIPAKEVGGDFYDFFLIDENRLGVLIADVSGKSVPAALFMVIAKTLLRNHLRQGQSPEDVFFVVNNQLAENNETVMFVTSFMGVLEIDTGVFTYVNAGHAPPAVRREDRNFKWLDIEPGFILGGLENIRFNAMRTRFFPGDMIFLYTDGVSEANNAEGELFGEDRVPDALNASSRETASTSECVAAMRESVRRFADGADQSDDITMLALLYNGVSDAEKLTLTADVRALNKLVAFLDACLDKSGFCSEEKYAVQLAMEEVFVNVARYAYPEGGGEVRVTCACGKGRVVITTEDGGKPYNPLLREDPDISLSAEEREIGGLGVYMTKGIMDAVYYDFRDGKNVLSMVKNVS
ncbi:MAG: SpoIIE family protein phosphatase [Clostridiales Family XIII bacterium]|jgi:sigma-B regulation protein RsbU (phosphoserine phosphatase)|nr:SpoIIE family protein phosphatase [Clostridiales Family XIII bacterium]